MRRFFIIFFGMLYSLIGFSQKVIQMEYDNGVYRIPCTVNGANMKMVFDTGASTVCLSLASALFLYQNGYIKSSDIIGSGLSSTASGEIVDHVKINIKDIEIGGLHLRNVEGVVMESLTSPLLLGQSAIQKLGTITIQGNQLIIGNANLKELQSETINKYFNYNDYLIDKELLIRTIKMEFEEFYYEFKRKSKEKEYEYFNNSLQSIISYIQSGDCSYSMGVMHFNNGFGNIPRSKKEQQIVGSAVWFVSDIAKKMVEKGQYKKSEY